MWYTVTRKARPKSIVRSANGSEVVELQLDDGTVIYAPLIPEEVRSVGLETAIRNAIERHNAGQNCEITSVPTDLSKKEFNFIVGQQLNPDDVAKGVITYESYLEEAVVLMEAVIDHESTIEQLKAEIASLKQALGR